MKHRDPKLIGTSIDYSCPWFDVVIKEVQREPSRPTEKFYCVDTLDYHVVLAITEDGRVPLVRQFRPAVEETLLELPAGNCERDETPEETARRELREETGCEPGDLIPLNKLLIDSGRMTTVQHAFFAPKVRLIDPAPRATEDLEVTFVSPAQLRAFIKDGSFRMASHLAVVCEAATLGFLKL